MEFQKYNVKKKVGISVLRDPLFHWKTLKKKKENDPWALRGGDCDPGKED